MDLRILLAQNKAKYGFISTSKLREMITPASIQKHLEKKAITLSISLDPKAVARSRKIIAVLVLLDLEKHIEDAIVQGFGDEIFPSKPDNISFLEDHEEKYQFCLKQWVIPPVFRPDQHIELPKEAILPFLDNTRINHGAFGIVYKVKVADGHLAGYGETNFAWKSIEVDDTEQDRVLMGEVVALRRRPHDNIVPLLASFSQSSVESSVGITSINLIFPYAEMDLETWMSLTDTPFAFAEKNPRMDLYQCTYELVSALAFLHRENIDGFSTSHHDLKPKNILVFGRKWKIADFGRAKLRSSIHGSETDGADGLGSYDYHPPEYYDDDGSRASRKHGRPFDVWAMGCIMLQVAVLIAFGWESGKVKEFRSARRSLPSTQRRFNKKRDGEDSSFHNSLPVVDEWIHKILEDGSKMLLQFLEITIQMLRGDSMDRLASWEVELDLYETLNPDHSTTQLIEMSKACIPRGKRPSSTLDTGKPLSRAITRHNMVRAICLIEAGHRLELLKEHEELSSLTSARLVSGSENFNKLLRKPTVHAMERYGIQLVANHYDVQPAVTKIPGKPFTAAKKPEDNVDPDQSVRLDIIRKDLYRGDHAAVKFQLRRLPNQLSAWKDSSGKTPLHYAADYCAKQSTITLILEEFPTPRSLILEVDSSGQTPFHVAATKGDFSTISVLLRYVEEPKLLLTMRDDLGNTPIGLARNFENWELVDILKDLTV